MKNRFPLSAVLLALALTLSTVPALAQSEGSEGRTMGDIIADALEDLARAVNPDAPIDPAAIDPTDPDSPIDPTDPDSQPGDVPAGPDPSDPDGSDPSGSGIELPEEAEDEEGGFGEIQLIPDPAPKAGTWRVINKRGLVSCLQAGTLPLKRSSETGTIAVLQDGRVLVGRHLFDSQRAPVRMKWDPDTNRYRGKVQASADGAATTLSFDARVLSANRMKGSLVAKVKVDAEGFSERCTVARDLTFVRQGN